MQSIGMYEFVSSDSWKQKNIESARRAILAQTERDRRAKSTAAIEALFANKASKEQDNIIK